MDNPDGTQQEEVLLRVSAAADGVLAAIKMMGRSRDRAAHVEKANLKANMAVPRANQEQLIVTEGLQRD